MKLKTTGLMAILLATGISYNANANMLFDTYAGATAGFGGITYKMDDHDKSMSAYSYGAFIGIDIPLVRIEGEYSHISADTVDLDLAMVNAYVKMPIPVVKPYIGAGIGMTFDGEYSDDIVKFQTQDSIAYQGMLGLTLDIPVLPFNVDVEGRVLYVPDAFDVPTSELDVLHYEGRVKLRYVF